jgi:hypothetical protein
MKSLKLESLMDRLKEALYPLTVEIERGPEQNEQNILFYVYDEFNQDEMKRRTVSHLNGFWNGEENYFVIEEILVRDSDYEGMDISKTITKSLIDSLSEQEVDRVELFAERDGIYFWSKAGFLPHQDFGITHDMLGRIEKRYKNAEGLSDSMAMHCEDLIEDLQRGWENLSDEEIEHLHETYEQIRDNNTLALWTAVDGPLASKILNENHSSFRALFSINNKEQQDKLNHFVPNPGINLQKIFELYASKGVPFMHQNKYFSMN